jgi:hypothetical protein
MRYEAVHGCAALALPVASQQLLRAVARARDPYQPGHAACTHVISTEGSRCCCSWFVRLAPLELLSYLTPRNNTLMACMRYCCCYCCSALQNRMMQCRSLHCCSC